MAKNGLIYQRSKVLRGFLPSRKAKFRVKVEDWKISPSTFQQFNFMIGKMSKNKLKRLTQN